MTTRRLAAIVLAVGMLADGMPVLADYPERSLHATIPWGAGGATDRVMRALTPYVEEELGTEIVISNRPGGTATLGTLHVMQQRPADGYHLLMAAENAQLYPLLGLAEFDYDALETINLVGQNLAVIATYPDSPWDSLEALLAHAEEHPGELRMGGTGAGGLPSTVLAMINAVTDLEVRVLTFGGDGPGAAALRARHIDFMPLSLIAAREQIASGELKGLAVVASEKAEVLPGVAPITETLPGVATYLPWASFWGVWVHRNTPEEIKTRLTEAFDAAVARDGFQAFLTENGAEPLNLSGAEAQDFLDHWQSVTSWALYDAGAVPVSPEQLGIPRPE
ncbi:tripartite tricarboxylate transporter substrate binding protein [Halomonas cerina]|uniref:Tripartite-type tricarboxylate transporter receptor subunit TctC n=1 Tax=Halomonas cerina TaxID=447424 RepID=A0A839V9C2_9GAMM|nr:tripartite tricarboxylate transporter substrate binding protein [Halomonas cerina]MBB3192243.1 tripartite-type tricarboxylate transporter receptor subunit TctC [Halomonas cerina]